MIRGIAATVIIENIVIKSGSVKPYATPTIPTCENPWILFIINLLLWLIIHALKDVAAIGIPYIIIGSTDFHSIFCSLNQDKILLWKIKRISVTEIETAIPKSNAIAPRWQTFTKNTDNNIVINWFKIVDIVNETDFNCALKS